MNLYVGNISRDVTEEDLRDTFQAYGTVDTISIIKDKFSGLPKGFAFIEMPVKQEAEAAIAGLKGKALKGRSLDVNEARPREDRRPRRENTGWNRSRSSNSNSIGHRY
ncbi:MAG TPA: RNA-binding protein [Bacteroidota bacterium]|jgi:RNA recognition motif-containing protein|nr:RNA-binding protein [Bacteroidota bacterium]